MTRPGTGHLGTLLWIAFVAIAAADVLLPGPSFSVFCLPVFFAFLVLVRPRYPWPLASAAACFLIGAWLLEQGLRTGPEAEPMAAYRIADRLLITLAILLVTGVHARLHPIHDTLAEFQRRRAARQGGLASPEPEPVPGRSVLFLSLATLAVIFAIDAVTPRNWNIGTLYLLPVLWISSLRRPLLLALFVPAAALLSASGYVLGPPSQVLPEPTAVLLERAISILALLVSGLVLTVHFTYQKAD